MLLAPVSDFSIAQFLMFSFLYGLAAYLVVLLVEAIALWLLQWGSFARSLRDSTVVNLITSVMGFLPIIFIPPWLDFIYDIGLPLGMFVLWALSVIVEGVVLYFISKNSFRRTMRISSMINICSYVLLYLFHPLID